MSEIEGLLDKALLTMQQTSDRVLALCRDKLPRGKGLTPFEVSELRMLIEVIGEGLEQDSLIIQEKLDEAKQVDPLEEEDVSDVSWPSPGYGGLTSSDLYCNENIDDLYDSGSNSGTDYDSDLVGSGSD